MSFITVCGLYTLLIMIIGAMSSLLDETTDIGYRIVIALLQVPCFVYIISGLN